MNPSSDGALYSDDGVDPDSIDLNGFRRGIDTYSMPNGLAPLDTNNINWEVDGFDDSPGTNDSATFDAFQLENHRSAFDSSSSAQADLWPVSNGHQRPFKLDWGSRRIRTSSVDMTSRKTGQSSTPDSITSPTTSPTTAPKTQAHQQSRRRNRRRNTAESRAKSATVSVSSNATASPLQNAVNARKNGPAISKHVPEIWRNTIICYNTLLIRSVEKSWL